MEQQSLKKLNFVPEYGTKGYNMAANAYTTAKSYVPAPVKDQLTKVEETVAAVSAPYVTKAQDKGSELLKAVDEQVEKTVQSVSQAYQSNSEYLQNQLEKQRQFHQHNMESYKAAREQYLKKVEESVDFIKSNGVAGAARKAADELSATIAEARKLPGLMVKQVQEAFERLMKFEPVQKLMNSTRPAVEAAYARYEVVHGAVVNSHQYKRAFDFSQAAIVKAQESFLYRKAKENVYPLVAKYADPAYASLTSSSYFQAAVQHITPKTVA